jgi:hypothetical protein
MMRRERKGDVMLALDLVAAEQTGVEVHEADEAHVRAVLDRQARAWLGVSGDAFLARLAAGGVDASDDPATARLISTARLLG